jgi:hypothetical protein
MHEERIVYGFLNKHVINISVLLIIVVNINVPAKGKTHYSRGSFCEEVEHVFDKFPKHHINFC